MPGHNAQEIIEEALSSWDDVPELDGLLVETDEEVDLTTLAPPPDAA
jgi:hypothetical protein